MISENTNQIAYEAVSALVDIIENEDSTEIDLSNNQVIIPVSLLEKQTT